MAEQMKPSGVDWIGEIPASWEVKSISYMSESRSGGTPDRNNLLYWENGTIPWMSSGEVNKVNIYDTDEKITTLATQNTSAKVIDKNSVVVALNGQGKTKGMSAILRIDSACNQSLCAFSCKTGILYYEYLFWCFQTMYTYLRHMSGDDVRDGLAASYVKKQKIPVPRYEEQKAITDYLDKECAQIDSIAADLEKQIELLQQYKQSLITETVTKGLDKSVPMKDSGVEWIGEIPYDWKAIRFRYVFSLDKGLTITKEDLVDDGVPVISYGQVHAKTNTGTGINDSLIRYVPELYLGTDRQSLAYQGNYIFADTSEDLGGVGNCVFIDINGALFAGYHTIISRIKGNSSEYFPKYFSYLFLSDMWRDQLRSKVMGVKVYSISQKLLKDTSILLPPKIIQQAIADYLDEKCATINSILDDKQAQLKVIQQHKKSLIYEYVTGKKRVKEVQ